MDVIQARWKPPLNEENLWLSNKQFNAKCKDLFYFQRKHWFRGGLTIQSVANRRLWYFNTRKRVGCRACSDKVADTKFEEGAFTCINGLRVLLRSTVRFRGAAISWWRGRDSVFHKRLSICTRWCSEQQIRDAEGNRSQRSWFFPQSRVVVQLEANLWGFMHKKNRRIWIPIDNRSTFYTVSGKWFTVWSKQPHG